MDREICHIFVSAARRELLAGSLGKNFYSILADESSDIAKKEQLSFSVRTCSNIKFSKTFLAYLNAWMVVLLIHFFII